MYCAEIKKILERGDVIKTSTEKYEGDTRKEKYKVLVISGFFSGKKEDMGRFNKARCKPGLTEDEIIELNKDIANTIQKIQLIQEKFKNQQAAPQQEVIPAELLSQAQGIYNSGKFPEYLETEFNKIWCGDQHILRWVIISFVNGFVQNSDEGLHLHIAGPSGLGKSEGVKAALRLLPEDYTLMGQFSRKGFLYKSGSLSPGTIVLHDDHKFDEEEAGLYRAIIAGWRGKSMYYSVDNGESKGIVVPERITQIITSADGIATTDTEGQNESRFTTIEISRSKETLVSIIDFIKKTDQDLDAPIDKKLLDVIWSLITNRKLRVEIPYLDNISVGDEALTKLREFKKFLCLIRAVALLRGRTVANTEDFDEAQKLWSYILVMIDNEIPGLTKTENVVFKKIQQLTGGGKRVELSALKSALPELAESSIYRAFSGKNGSFTNPTGGLLTKIRGLTITQKYDRDSGESDRIIELQHNPTMLCTFSPYLLSENEVRMKTPT